MQWSIGLFAKQVRWITSIFGISLACIYMVLYINNRTTIRLNTFLNQTGLTMTCFFLGVQCVSPGVITQHKWPL